VVKINTFSSLKKVPARRCMRSKDDICNYIQTENLLKKRRRRKEIYKESHIHRKKEKLGKLIAPEMKVDGKGEEETEKPIKRKSKTIAELTYKQRFHSIFLVSSLGVRIAELTLLFLLFLYFSRESFERFPHRLTWIID
jgi:hypothetical protein